MSKITEIGRVITKEKAESTIVNLERVEREGADVLCDGTCKDCLYKHGVIGLVAFLHTSYNYNKAISLTKEQGCSRMISATSTAWSVICNLKAP
ncbi:hypothetical protein [Geomicrobium sp. JCM 19039]|uniref:hypothetical protein n=1 Tax=Geomicrobium sp. JCM 19039 TaxID=1460636 RepID=UPI00045F1DFA|nr:hypothetical protein [Geomicrobium sp. JCM 19039]GAK13981.1 hypothetical protein JCM19039_3869 [Geomicrobium sp. JCM 19039]